jgi:alpha-tubulin suppressor-like RCC1 family protein
MDGQSWACGRRLVPAGVLLAVAGLCVWFIVAANAAGPGGRLLAFGSNEYGQLGSTLNVYSPAQVSYPFNPTPKFVTLPGRKGVVTQVVGGLGHTLVVTSTGQLYAFGDNSYGQLGVPHNAGVGINNPKPNPTPMLVTLPGQTGKISKVAAGAESSFVLTSTGQLYAFGNNLSGQLGLATNVGIANPDLPNAHAAPNPIPTLVTLPGLSGRVTQIAAGADHALVLSSTGQLYAFGDNTYGELGTTTNLGKPGAANPTPTLVVLPGLEGRPTKIAAGDNDSLVATSSGQLYAFGGNRFGALGTAVHSGTTNGVNPKPTPTPTLITLAGRRGSIRQIAGGGEHTLVLTSSGQLYAFGNNTYGELGSTTDYTNKGKGDSTPTLVTLPGLEGTVTHIAAGGASSMAITSGNQLYAFGWNLEGELGVKLTHGMIGNFRPAQVALPTGTTPDVVAAAYDFTLVIVSGA